MEDIIIGVFLSVIYLLSLTVYAIMIANILPRFLLRIEYDVKDKLGRGLKKITHPEGRAVVYETHPSVRKYINKYLLFTHNGYKYIQSEIGKGVKYYTANVVSFNNRNKVISAIDIYESVGDRIGQPVRLHADTSYVAYILTSVNGTSLQNTEYMKIRLTKTPIYLVTVILTTFIELLYSMQTAYKICDLIDKNYAFDRGAGFFITPSVLIGFVCLGTALMARMKKGVKVVLK